MRHTKSTTPFAVWARAYGPAKLATDLGVTRWAVYAWMVGRSYPVSARLATILTLAAGRLSLQDLTRPEAK